MVYTIYTIYLIIAALVFSSCSLLPPNIQPTPTSIPVPTIQKNTEITDIYDLFSQITSSTNIKFSSPQIVKTTWNHKVSPNNIQSLENIPAYSISNSEVPESDLEKIDSFLVSNGLEHSYDNYGDGTVIGTRGFISKNMFCHLNIASVMKKDGSFTDMDKIDLVCGLVSDIK